MSRSRASRIQWIAVAGLLLAADRASAEETPAQKVEAEKEAKPVDGWKATAKIGLTGSLSNNRMVVGAEQGTSFQLGTVLGVAANLRSGQHLWENSLDIQLGGSKTPQIEKFVKSSDLLDLKSSYLYTLESIPWFGFYGGLKLGTQILPSNLVRPVAYTVVEQDSTGAAMGTRTVGAQRNITTTSAFEPLVLRQSAGVFAKPYEQEVFSFRVKLGPAVQEIIARDGFIFTGEDAAASTITLKQLETTFDAGAELGIVSSGYIVKQLLTWKLGVDLFQPFYTTSKTELSTFEQLNVEIVAGLSLQLVSWLSLDYLFTTKRIPLILDDWQIQHLLVLSAGVDLI